MDEEFDRRVCGRIAERPDELVELLRGLVSFDTTVEPAGAPAPVQQERNTLANASILVARFDLTLARSAPPGGSRSARSATL